MPYKNPEDLRQHQAAYYAAHREDIKNDRVIYRATHLEEIKARDVAYGKTHREVKRIYSAIYRQMHLEAEKARTAAYAAAHREELRVYKSAYKAVHQKEIKVYQAAYSVTHREERKVNNQRRRAQQRGVTATLTLAQWEAIKVAYRYLCAYCGKKPQTLTQDHVIPITKRGGTVPDNIVPACRPCNSSKGNRKPTLVPAIRLMV